MSKLFFSDNNHQDKIAWFTTEKLRSHDKNFMTDFRL